MIDEQMRIWRDCYDYFFMILPSGCQFKYCYGNGFIYFAVDGWQKQTQI